MGGTMHETTVEFIIGGTQKGGTTALAKFVSAHPGVFMARQKEVHFFNRDENFAGPEPDYGAYHRHFRDAPPGRLRGESTPAYLYWPTAAERIRDYHPGMRLIFILRNPVERAYSHYVMKRLDGEEPLPFPEALRREEARIAAGARERLIYSYIDRGRYAGQILRFRKAFPEDRLLFLKTEDLRQRHAETMARVVSFLGLPPGPPTRHEIVFSNTYGEMDPATRALLLKIFEPEIKRLEDLLGWDCAAWRS